MKKKQTKKEKEKNKEYYQKWYAGKGKKWMQEYMKEYYQEHKIEMRLEAKESKMKYDRPLKNLVRENVIDILNQYKIKKILTLESEDFIFSNLVPDKKVIVFENDLKTFKKMEKNKPSNVRLFYGDISKFAELDSKVEAIYLDFCGIYEFSKEEIFKLKECIRNCKIFAVTFALRIGSEAKKQGIEKHGDYQFDLIRKMQELTEVNFKVLYGEAYRDTQPMVTMVFENTLEEKE